MLQADELEAKVHELRAREASEQAGHAAMQSAMAADREDITKQGAALVDLGKKVWVPILMLSMACTHAQL